MRISVKTKTNASADKVEKTDSGFAVFVTKSPERGKANLAVIKILADYFNMPPSNLHIISGFTSKNKLIEIKSEHLK